MTTSVVKFSDEPLALGLEFSDVTLRLNLVDGRELSVPLEWFPRLRDATSDQRANWHLIGRGQGISWPDLDEDVSVRLLLGLPS